MIDVEEAGSVDEIRRRYVDELRLERQKLLDR